MFALAQPNQCMAAISEEGDGDTDRKQDFMPVWFLTRQTIQNSTRCTGQ
jgi:hypothetical protein